MHALQILTNQIHGVVCWFLLWSFAPCFGWCPWLIKLRLEGRTHRSSIACGPFLPIVYAWHMFFSGKCQLDDESTSLCYGRFNLCMGHEAHVQFLYQRRFYRWGRLQVGVNTEMVSFDGNTKSSISSLYAFTNSLLSWVSQLQL